MDLFVTNYEEYCDFGSIKHHLLEYMASSESISLLKKQKLPIILNQNGVFYPAWFKEDWEKRNLTLARIYHSADYVFWQSNFCRMASNKFLGKRTDNGEVLYNAVYTERFIPKL